MRRIVIAWGAGLICALGAATVIWWLGGASPKVVFELEGTPFRRAILIQDPNAPDIRTTINVLVGEADMQGPEGQAHYLEHLLARQIGMLAHGSSDARKANATTTDLLTYYWYASDRDSFDKSAADLMRIFDPLTIDEDFAREEREIVVREYDLRMLEAPFRRADTALERAIFAGTGLARDVIGTPEEIRHFTLKDAGAIHERFYRPENAVLVVQGNIRPDEVIAALPKDLPAWTGDRKIVPPVFDFQPAARHARQVLQEKDEKPFLLAETLVELPQKTPVLETWRQASLFADIMETALPGGLFRPLSFDAFVATDLDVWYAARDERHYTLKISLYPDRGIVLDEAQRLLRQTLDGIVENGIPADSCERVRKRRAAKHTADDDPRIKANRMASAIGSALRMRSLPLDLAEFEYRGEASCKSLNAFVKTLRGNAASAVVFVEPIPSPAQSEASEQ
ncbi:M16 family metallopeptidase [Martelella alba]|uniref:M16 family metallopeptidase n=1 Tax=Martelella alba TaxID=2590451 RepID=UPI0015E843F0|nr:insulinase family protein [Martelella alba]